MQAETAYRPVDYRKPRSSRDDRTRSPLINEGNVQSSRLRASSHWTDWKWELILLSLSVLSLVATAVTLYRLSGSSLDSWGGFFLRPNTLVSILAAMSKTSLAFAVSSCIAQAKWNWYRRGQDNLLVFERFDEASKGPWGSFRLLGTIRLRYTLMRTGSHWSALGALIILTLLAYEPFLQTIITQYGILDREPPSTRAITGQCMRLDSGRVKFDLVPFSLGNYNKTGVEACSRWRQPVSEPELGMQASVFNGFQNSLQTRKMNASASCPTGNCTFGRFVSLGVCSKCADISTYVTKHKIEYPRGHYNETVDSDNVCSNGSSVSDAWGRVAPRFYNYTMFRAGSLDITNHDGTRNKDDRTICTTNDTSVYMATSSSKNISQSFHVANTSTSTSFVLFQGLRASDAYAQSRETWQDSQPTAFECELSFCAKMYSSRYENGQFIEYVLGEWVQPIADSYKPFNCRAENRSGDNQFSESSTTSLGYRSDFRLGVPEAERKMYVLPPDLSFNVSQATIVSTIDWFESTFGHKMTYPAAGIKASAGIAETLYNSTTNITGESIDGISAVFAAVADSMSIWIRDRQLSLAETADGRRSPGTPPRVGTVKRWTIRFGVRWPFMALPLVLELAGALYVGFTIHETRRLGIAAWKDSALATIVYGLGGEEIRALLKEADVQGSMECAARQMRVSLVKNSIVCVPDLEPDDLLDNSSVSVNSRDENHMVRGQE
ncbi:hypothetical protein PG995_012809 [Apiospora arundinis]